MPLVSVVTPFYNTAPLIRRCIESVLAQAFGDFEYVLVNNCSTDGSRELAAEYAARDPRIRLLDQPAFLGQLDNFNSALRAIAPGTRYVKMVLADDALLPGCLAEMVGVAESDPSVGLVSSYWRPGDHLAGAAAEWARTTWDGAEIARRHLLERIFLFGSPSTVMYRADLVRARPAFFDVSAYHADTKAAYELLRESRFGFVHQVLSYLSRDAESLSGRVMRLEPWGLAHYLMAMQFGAWCLAPAEWDALRRRERRWYLGFLALGLVSGRGREFRDYHLKGLATIGEAMPWSRVLRYLPAGVAQAAAAQAERLARRLRRLGGAA